MLVEAKDPAAVQLRAQQGQTIKIVDIEKDLFELLGLKDASKYYEKLPQEGGTDEQTEQGGAGGTQGGSQGSANGQPAGIQGNLPAVAGV